MPQRISFNVKEGWKLNPNERIVNGIVQGLGRNDGHCPCHHPERRGNDICPCTEYLKYDTCYCQLYVKKEQSSL
jgi:ferredoxin-thioredoxin reductase catalytic subunit